MAEKLELTLHILTNAEVAASKMRQFNKTLDQNNKKIKEANSLYTKFRRIFGSIFMTYLGFNGIRSMVNTVRELDLMERSITGLTKSTQDWAYIQNEAFRTANRIKDVAKGYRNFYAAASMAGFDKGAIQSLYSDVLTSTRAIGASQTQTSAALLALEQMISKGVVSMEELRRQLGNALPGAFEIGAKAMNMTTQEFNEFVKKGQLASNVFIPRFIAQLKKEYAGGFKDAMQSMDASIINLENSWVLLQKTIVGKEANRGISKAVNDLSAFLRSREVVAVARLINYALGFIISNLKTIVILLTPILARQGWVFLLGIIPKITKALWGMTAPLMATYKQFLKILAIAFILQDLIYGLFFPKHTSSLTEDLLGKSSLGTGLQNRQNSSRNFEDWKKYRQAEREKYGILGASFRNIGMNYIEPFYNVHKFFNRDNSHKFMSPYIPPISPNAQGLYQSNRTDNHSVYLTPNFYINGSGLNEEKVAEIVTNTLWAQYTSTLGGANG